MLISLPGQCRLRYIYHQINSPVALRREPFLRLPRNVPYRLEAQVSSVSHNLGPFVTTLSQAPLIEVATQIRWGVAERNEKGELIRFVFSEAEEKEFPVVLQRVLAEAGFTEHDPFAPELDDVQFAVSHRFRRGPEQWPVYQSGLGVFAINQANEGYDWPTYKADVLAALSLLVKTLRGYYESTPFIGIELMYIDGFPLEDGQQPYDFLGKQLRVKIMPAKGFLSAPFISSKPLSASLSLELKISEPNGSLTLGLDYGELPNGHSGYVMDTRVRSLGSEVEYSRDGIDRWLEAAHRVQQHAFQTLIQPAYMKSFK